MTLEFELFTSKIEELAIKHHDIAEKQARCKVKYDHYEIENDSIYLYYHDLNNKENITILEFGNISLTGSIFTISKNYEFKS